MATVINQDSNPVMIVIVLTLLAVAFAGGYYYYQQKDKDTILDVNIGGKNISATVDHK